MARLPETRFTRFGDDLKPNFMISISGKDASKAAPVWDAIRPYVAGVIFEEDEDLAATLTITVINKSKDTLGAQSDFKAVLNSKAFQEGNFIDLWIGYSSMHYMGRVEIVKWLPVFPEEGPITLTIIGYDGRHKMTKTNEFKVKKGKRSKRTKKRKTGYSKLTDDQIVKKIAAKYGYGADVDVPEIKRTRVKGSFVARVQPADMSDWDFLKKLAAINRFDLWVDYSQAKKKFIVHFKKKQDASNAVYLFEYRQGNGSLLSATPDFSITEQPTEVEVTYFDRKRRVIERTLISDTTKSETVKLSSAGAGDLEVKKEVGRGASVRFTAFGQNIEAFTNRPFASKNEATAFVKNWLKEREDDFLHMNGKAVGVETLRPRQIHQFAGLTTRLDGFYRLTQTRHTLEPGRIYSCEFLSNKVLSEQLARRKPTTKTTTKPKSKLVQPVAKQSAIFPLVG